MSETLLKALLYRAIRELNYVQEAEVIEQVASSEGRAIIEQSMRVLGVRDLSRESLFEPPERDV